MGLLAAVGAAISVFAILAQNDVFLSIIAAIAGTATLFGCLSGSAD